jgi:hypothetical protein
MDRRRLVLTASSAAALSGSATFVPNGALSQAVRSSVPEYVGAMTIMRRTVDWVEQEVSRLMAAQDREDEDWRIDVLAPFATVEAVRDAGRTVVPPGKFATAHARWLDAVDELVVAGLHLRTGVLDDNERSFEFATRAMDRASVLLDEVDAFLPRRARPIT